MTEARDACADPVSANGLCDILDPVAAERAVIEIELVSDLIVNRLRDANCAGLGERFEPGGDIDAIAENVVAVDNYVAEIDADPELKPALGRDGVVYRPRGALHLDRTAQRIDDARKIRQQAVARRADDPSVMRGDQRVNGAPQVAKRAMRAGLILAHQPAEPHYIHMQNGGELPFPGGGFSRRIGG